MLNYIPSWIISMVLIILISVLFYQVYFRIINAYSDDKNRITVVDKLGSILPYGLPLLEGLQNFGQQILPDYPFSLMSLYKKTLMPFVIFYVTHPALAFIIFFVLYYLFVRAKSPMPNRPFIRFNVLQSILLFLINSLLGATFRALPIEFRVSIYGLMLCNTLFWFVLSTIIYSIVKSIQGKYAKIPVISQAVRIQIDSQ
uniref:Tic20 family protein Ycf60 n=2 Tax=Membranoptera TaxID=158697 RepID=A0A1L1Y9X9_9FLOR|nr:Tic20 family protein Ycf60 [Membranoptera weeksiae]YP_009332802.1 Tic20 family protein Ycf60 [Membranoptera tenuis]AHZ94596.1 Tic20 family protein Ycf60 [Membranoptera weeksiae]AKL79058.1 Tic20 family protein Ycf60 [Membranoptera tenuis]